MALKITDLHSLIEKTALQSCERMTRSERAAHTKALDIYWAELRIQTERAILNGKVVEPLVNKVHKSYS